MGKSLIWNANFILPLHPKQYRTHVAKYLYIKIFMNTLLVSLYDNKNIDEHFSDELV